MNKRSTEELYELAEKAHQETINQKDLVINDLREELRVLAKQYWHMKLNIPHRSIDGE